MLLIRLFLYFFAGLGINPNGRLEPLPVNNELVQFNRSVLYQVMFTYGLIERMVLKTFFWKLYCRIVCERISNWDFTFLERKVREKIDGEYFSAGKNWSQFDEEIDVPDNTVRGDFETTDPEEKRLNRSGFYFGKAAKVRVRLMKQMIFLTIINRLDKPIIISKAPDLPYELLIQDTVMFRWLTVRLFRYQIEHVPYTMGLKLTDSAVDDMLSDSWLKELCLSIE